MGGAWLKFIPPPSNMSNKHANCPFFRDTVPFADDESISDIIIIM